MVVGSLLEGGGCGCVGGCFGQGRRWGWGWAFVVWLEDWWDCGAGQGSSILPSVVHSSRVLRARGGRRGRGRLGRLVRFGIGVVGGALGAADRWVVCVLGHRDSIHSRVAIG